MSHRTITLSAQAYRTHIICMLMALLMLLTFASVAAGSHGTRLSELLPALFQSDQASTQDSAIIRDIRFPRACLAALVGAMLGMAGAAMQSLTRNDLAEPGLIGIKEGASVSIVALIILMPATPLIWRPVVGVAGGLAAGLIAFSISHTLSRLRFVLVGIGVSWTLAAFLSLLITTANIRDVQTALLWLAGSLHTASWDYVKIAAPVGAFGALGFLVTSRDSTILMLGDTAAKSLGVALKVHIITRLVIIVVLTATSVTCAGSLGFIGLIAPHAARLIIGRDDIALTFGSALLGALIVLTADNVARLAFAPLQIPTGIVVASIGAPLMLTLIWTRRHEI